MNLTQQIFAQAVLLAGELMDRQEALLRLLCSASANALAAKLRKGITPQDCKADFVAAASLYALAALSEAEGLDGVESFSVGDLTVNKGKSTAASACLRRQADLMISPYCVDSFSFQGV